MSRLHIVTLFIQFICRVHHVKCQAGWNTSWNQDGWEKYQYHLRYADYTILMAESEEELKSLLMKVKEQSEKAGLKFNIQKTKIMASSPITSWQIYGQTMEIVTDFIFGGSKIIADGDWSHEIKRCLLLGRKATTNLDSILKSRDITLPSNVHLVKAMVFPVVMYGCECWTIKNPEHQGSGAFELWRRLEKTLESPLYLDLLLLLLSCLSRVRLCATP